MKFNVNLNQPAMIEYSLTVNQFAVLDVLSASAIWAKVIQVNDKSYFWTARSKIAEELKAFRLKEDTVYRIFKAIKEK